jgi:serine/threonine protein kinase
MGQAQTFLREAVTHKGLRHPNIVQILGIVLKPPSVVLEWMARGTLYAALRDETIALSDETKNSFLLDVARGLVFLHSSDVVHRDIKSLNILLSDKWIAKISDLGSARERRGTMTAMVGTQLWAAPEVLTGSRTYGTSCDVYSFGVVLFETLTRQNPYEMNADFPLSLSAQIQYVAAGGRPHFGDVAVADDLRSLAQQCWAADPELRPHMADVLAVLELRNGLRPSPSDCIDGSTPLLARSN